MLTAKERRWLGLSACPASGGGYPGVHWDMAPKQFVDLERRGLVRLFEPNNMAHKARAVITERGRQLLAAAP